MNPPSKSERKEWWLYCHAHISIRRALETCNILLSSCESNRDILFPSLSLAIHAFYSRPFKSNRGVGFLPKELIPKENQGIHEWIIDFRDSTLVHTDATEKEAAKAPYHELVYSNNGSEREYSTFEPAPPIEAYRDAKTHIERMHGIVLYRVALIHERFENLIPVEDGDFLFQFNKEPLFIPHTIRNEIHLSYKPTTTIGS